jgi:hypothetical protein
MMLTHFFQTLARHPFWNLASIALIIAWLWPDIRRWRLRRRNCQVLRYAETAAQKRWEGHRRQ